MSVPNHVAASAALGAARVRWNAVAAQLADAPGPFDEDLRDEVEAISKAAPTILVLVDARIAELEHATSCSHDALISAVWAADALHEIAHRLEGALRFSVLSQQGGGNA